MLGMAPRTDHWQLRCRPGCACPTTVTCCLPGRVVIEVFADVTPLPARAFVNRCRSAVGVKGTAVHRIIPLLGIYFGNNSQ